MRTNRKREEGEKERGRSESLVAAWRGVCEKWKRLKVGQQQPASSESGEGVRRHGGVSARAQIEILKRTFTARGATPLTN